MTTEGSHPVCGLRAGPLEVTEDQRAYREGLPVGEQARVFGPALEEGVEKKINEEKGGGIRQERRRYREGEE